MEKKQGVILILDDEIPILASLQRLLRKEPYTVLCTTDPEEALQWLRETSIQLIISDYRMEAMSGLEFIRKAHDIAPHSIKVIYSGYAHEEHIETILSEKILDRFISKPWDPKAVKEEIKAMLQDYECRTPKAA